MTEYSKFRLTFRNYEFTVMLKGREVETPVHMDVLRLTI